MNKVILTGRIAKDPEILKVGSSTETAVTRYVLAVEKKPPPEIGSKVDFISVTAFGKDATFAARWFLKGTRVTVMGRIQTGSYPPPRVCVWTSNPHCEKKHTLSI